MTTTFTQKRLPSGHIEIRATVSEFARHFNGATFEIEEL